MVKHGARRQQLIQGCIKVVAGGALEGRDLAVGQHFAELLDGSERERAEKRRRSECRVARQSACNKFELPKHEYLS